MPLFLVYINQYYSPRYALDLMWLFKRLTKTLLGLLTLLIIMTPAQRAMAQGGATTLTLVKNVVGGSAPPSDWNLIIQGQGVAPFFQQGTSGSAGITNVSVTPGGTFALSETNFTGSASLHELTDLSCSGAADTTTSVATPTVTINAGEQVTCTFTNTFLGGSLTLIKQVNGGIALPSEWTLFMSGSAVPGFFQQGISGAASITNVEVQSNTNITVGENNNGSGTNTAFQFTLTAINCSGSDPNGMDGLIVQPGEDVTCVLVNSLPGAGSLTVTKTVSPTGAITTITVLNYNIAIENDGSQSLTNVSINDVLTQGGAPRTLTSGPTIGSGDTNNNGVLDVGETWNFSASYAITQSDIDNGSDILNTADVSTTEGISGSGNVTTPIIQNNTLVTDKIATFLLDNNSDGLAGVDDIIRYTYIVTNSGNTTLSNIALNDTDNAFGSFPDDLENGTLTDNGTLGDSFDSNPDTTIWGVLAPGDLLTFIEDYTVVQGDVDNLQ